MEIFAPELNSKTKATCMSLASFRLFKLLIKRDLLNKRQLTIEKNQSGRMSRQKSNSISF